MQQSPKREPSNKEVNDTYPNATEMVRNLSQMGEYEVLETHGKFRIVRLAPPYYNGFELWVVNEKGFMWEPAATVEAGRVYLQTDEAREYNAT